MSTTTDILRSIEQHAERAIAQELHLMIQQVLGMRTALFLDDRAHADALLLKLDRLIDDQVVRPIDTNALTPRPPLKLDELLLLPSPSDYEVRFFNRDYGDLEEVIVVDSFPLAVQVAADRHKADPHDLSEASWADDRGTLTVRSHHGTVLLRIEAIERPIPVVQPHIAWACQALENGETAPTQQLFGAGQALRCAAASRLNAPSRAASPTATGGRCC